ncbi:MAG: BatD family protein [Acidobacteriota bacterium]
MRRVVIEHGKGFCGGRGGARTVLVRSAILALFASAMVVSTATAQGVSASIDRPESTIQDPLVLTVRVEGSRSAQPQLPELPDFDVRSRGKSTQMSFVNGQLSSSVSYEFVLTPKRTGSLTVGPVEAEIDGEIYASDPFTVRIVEATQSTQDTRDLFLTAKVSTTTPYVGQEVVYVWRFYRRVRIGDANLESQDFSGFLVEDLGELREYQSTVNGVQYLVSELRKSLFPQEVGTMIIPASRLTCEVLTRSRRRTGSLFDDFFSPTATETKVLRTRQIELEVKPLPPAPENYSGLVGDFEIEGSVSQAELKVGESTTLRLTVRGSGNVQMISEPVLPDLTNFKTYGDKPSGTIEREGARLSGYKTYSRALVPLEPGEPVIPPVELTYFDPDEARYRIASTAAIPLRVGPGDVAEDLNLTEAFAPSTGKVAVRILADDLLPIRRGVEVVQGAKVPGWVVAAGLLAPAGLFLATLLMQRRRLRFAEDQGFRRRHQAMKQFRSGLGELASSSIPDSDRAQLASKILRGYVGDKVGVEGTALTAAEVDQQLRDRGVDSDLVVETHALLERLEAAQYGSSGLAVDALSGELQALVRRLERQIGA